MLPRSALFLIPGLFLEICLFFVFISDAVMLVTNISILRRVSGYYNLNVLFFLSFFVSKKLSQKGSFF